MRSLIPLLCVTSLLSTEALGAYSPTWEDDPNGNLQGVKSILAASCTQCHSTGNYNWTDYDAVKLNLQSTVTPSSVYACDGILACAAAGSPMPAHLSAAEIANLSSWAEGGIFPRDPAGPAGPPQEVAEWDPAPGSTTPLGNPKVGIKTFLTTACGSCHNQTLYPLWLRFDDRDTVKANSYYSPGRTKAQAIIYRVNDGTMPPGGAPGTGLTAAQLSLIQTWMNNGYLP